MAARLDKLKRNRRQPKKKKLKIMKAGSYRVKADCPSGSHLAMAA
jgi:ubiquinone biosynthesis protein COQ9